MANDGVRKLHETRTNTVVELLHLVCQLLLKKNQKMTNTIIALKIREMAKQKKIDEKYIVDSQTLGRNEPYKTIIKDYKKKVKASVPTKNKVNFDKFKLRDKFDMLSQDYIELLDEKKWIEKEKKQLEEKNYELKMLFNQNYHQGTTESKTTSEIIRHIKNIIKKGPVIINKNSNKIIIKSYKQSNEYRYELNEDDWDKL